MVGKKVCSSVVDITCPEERQEAGQSIRLLPSDEEAGPGGADTWGRESQVGYMRSQVE